MKDLTPEEIEETRTEAEREIGLQVAVWEDVQVGWYTRRVRTIFPPAADFCSNSESSPTFLETVFEPCHIPRFEKRVKWVREEEIMPVHFQDRQCFNSQGVHKRWYTNKRDAKRAAKGAHTGGHKLMVYRCGVCDRWHLGHKRKSG